MKIQASAIAFVAFATSANAFAPSTRIASTTNVALKNALVEQFELGTIDDAIKYQPGKADTEFARRFGGLVGKDIKTVGEAFTEFTDALGYSVNALYKGMVTDIVGSTHLILVNARFKRDPVWSLGILTSLDLLLKNYPEPGMQDKIVTALFKSVGLDEASLRADAKMMEEWAQGKTKEEIEAAIVAADPSNPLGAVAAAVKADEFWMYSRYFGIGLVKLMDISGVEMDKDEVYPLMENWMSKQLGKSHLTACSDSDLFFKIKDKLDMMETMMKEIEIREKKRMAERLEAKAEAALKAAEREKMAKEIESEAQQMKDRVESK